MHGILLRIFLFVFILGMGLGNSFFHSAQAAKGPYPYLKTPFFDNVDVLIDVGHGGVDSGTLYGELYEKDINLALAKLTYELMQKKGLRVLINRIDDYALSGENLWLRSPSRHLKDLAQRSHLANEVHPKAVISLHVNWSKNNSKRGAVVLHQASESSKRLAACLQESLNGLYGTSEKPVRGRTFYLLKHVKAPAVIVEMGFISNAQDREQMTRPEKQRELAEAIVQGVTAFLK